MIIGLIMAAVAGVLFVVGISCIISIGETVSCEISKSIKGNKK